MSQAMQIVKALGGRWRGRHGFAKCPCHKDDTPSLHIVESPTTKVLLRCFAGCDRMDIINELAARGLWIKQTKPRTKEEIDAQRKRMAEMEAEAIADEQRRLQTAEGLWDYSMEIQGTLGEDYLRGRSITCRLPSSVLRYHPACYHSETRSTYSAMVARLDDNRGFRACQRTYLSPLARKAHVASPKMTLGSMHGAAVRLGRVIEGRLGLAEGIETALSAAQHHGLNVWAVLSNNRYTEIDIPDDVYRIDIYGDAHDELTFQAAEEFERRGYECEITLPPNGLKDFNDMLMAGGINV